MDPPKDGPKRTRARETSRKRKEEATSGGPTRRRGAKKTRSEAEESLINFARPKSVGPPRQAAVHTHGLRTGAAGAQAENEAARRRRWRRRRDPLLVDTAVNKLSARSPVDHYYSMRRVVMETGMPSSPSGTASVVSGASKREDPPPAPCHVFRCFGGTRTSDLGYPWMYTAVLCIFFRSALPQKILSAGRKALAV